MNQGAITKVNCSFQGESQSYKNKLIQIDERRKVFKSKGRSTYVFRNNVPKILKKSNNVKEVINEDKYKDEYEDDFEL